VYATTLWQNLAIKLLLWFLKQTMMSEKLFNTRSPLEAELWNSQISTAFGQIKKPCSAFSTPVRHSGHVSLSCTPLWARLLLMGIISWPSLQIRVWTRGKQNVDFPKPWETLVVVVVLHYHSVDVSRRVLGSFIDSTPNTVLTWTHNKGDGTGSTSQLMAEMRLK